MKKDKANEAALKKKKRDESPGKTLDWGEFARYIKPFEWYGA